MKTANQWAEELQSADPEKPWRKIITPEQIAVIQREAVGALAHRVRGLASLQHYTVEDARKTLQMIYDEGGNALRVELRAP